jgi:hypothetical protein
MFVREISCRLNLLQAKQRCHCVEQASLFSRYMAQFRLRTLTFRDSCEVPFWPGISGPGAGIICYWSPPHPPNSTEQLTSKKWRYSRMAMNVRQAQTLVNDKDELNEPRDTRCRTGQHSDTSSTPEICFQPSYITSTDLSESCCATGLLRRSHDSQSQSRPCSNDKRKSPVQA